MEIIREEETIEECLESREKKRKKKKSTHPNDICPVYSSLRKPTTSSSSLPSFPCVPFVSHPHKPVLLWCIYSSLYAYDYQRDRWILRGQSLSSISSSSAASSSLSLSSSSSSSSSLKAQGEKQDIETVRKKSSFWTEEQSYPITSIDSICLSCGATSASLLQYSSPCSSSPCSSSSSSSHCSSSLSSSLSSSVQLNGSSSSSSSSPSSPSLDQFCPSSSPLPSGLAGPPENGREHRDGKKSEEDEDVLWVTAGEDKLVTFLSDGNFEILQQRQQRKKLTAALLFLAPPPSSSSVSVRPPEKDKKRDERVGGAKEKLQSAQTGDAESERNLSKKRLAEKSEKEKEAKDKRDLERVCVLLADKFGDVYRMSDVSKLSGTQAFSGDKVREHMRKVSSVPGVRTRLAADPGERRDEEEEEERGVRMDNKNERSVGDEEEEKNGKEEEEEGEDEDIPIISHLTTVTVLRMFRCTYTRPRGNETDQDDRNGPQSFRKNERRKLSFSSACQSHTPCARNSTSLTSVSDPSCSSLSSSSCSSSPCLLSEEETEEDFLLVSADRDEKIRVSFLSRPWEIQSFFLGHSEFITDVVLLNRKQARPSSLLLPSRQSTRGPALSHTRHETQKETPTTTTSASSSSGTSSSASPSSSPSLGLEEGAREKKKKRPEELERERREVEAFISSRHDGEEEKEKKDAERRGRKRGGEEDFLEDLCCVSSSADGTIQMWRVGDGRLLTDEEEEEKGGTGKEEEEKKKKRERRSCVSLELESLFEEKETADIIRERYLSSKEEEGDREDSSSSSFLLNSRDPPSSSGRSPSACRQEAEREEEKANGEEEEGGNTTKTLAGNVGSKRLLLLPNRLFYESQNQILVVQCLSLKGVLLFCFCDSSSSSSSSSSSLAREKFFLPLSDVPSSLLLSYYALEEIGTSPCLRGIQPALLSFLRCSSSSSWSLEENEADKRKSFFVSKKDPVDEKERRSADSFGLKIPFLWWIDSRGELRPPVCLWLPFLLFLQKQSHSSPAPHTSSSPSPSHAILPSVCTADDQFFSSRNNRKAPNCSARNVCPHIARLPLFFVFFLCFLHCLSFFLSSEAEERAPGQVDRGRRQSIASHIQPDKQTVIRLPLQCEQRRTHNEADD